ncbi:hypothetical protein [Paraburkholderia sp. HD33-4]|nr:hypothetical protein [Paraburkholderia sp. HD33-4]
MSSFTTEQLVASQKAGVDASTLNQAVVRVLKRLHSGGSKSMHIRR